MDCSVQVQKPMRMLQDNSMWIQKLLPNLVKILMCEHIAKLLVLEQRIYLQRTKDTKTKQSIE